LKHTTNYKAHDEQNQCDEGDIVTIIESKPSSRDKRWSVLEIVEKKK
jgi:small subunit ribosomal protein S17